MSLIELIIFACLVSGNCTEFRLSYDAQQVSLMTCLIGGQAQIAQWQAAHPGWRVRRWRCALVTPSKPAV